MRLMRSAPHDERNISRSQIRFNISQPLIEKRIVPKISVRKIRYSRKIDHERQFKQVRDIYSKVDGMVVDTALRTLHPIDDASSVGIRCSASANHNTRIVRPTIKLIG